MAVTYRAISDATDRQLKDWLFAIAWNMRPQVRSATDRYKLIYERAKEHIGCKSLVFDVEKYKKNVIKAREDMPVRHYVDCLVDSLNVNSLSLKRYARSIGFRFSEFLHEGIQLREWADITTNMKPMIGRPSLESVELARAIYKEEKFDILGILADRLEDDPYCEADIEHFRSSPHHSIACPVLTRIRRFYEVG